MQSLVAGRAGFRLVPRDGSKEEEIARQDPNSAAMRFIRGSFDVDGPIQEAVRWWLTRGNPGLRAKLAALAARFGPWKLLSQAQDRQSVAERLRYHYDRSNDFYRLFLGRNLVYSCAYYGSPSMTLEEAQEAKLRHVCRKLDLKPGDRFLDIGCGWASLLIHAAGQFGVRAVGCTLSREQVREGRRRVEEAGLGSSVQLLESDYRELCDRFDRIASIGMVEHVTRRGLGAYFRKAYELLAPGGLFLNHGIVRPEPEHDDPGTLFIQREVFPVGGITHLTDVIREAELAGFEVLDVENLREHYTKTCEEWVRRLQENRDECLRLVSEETWRIWVLYLAGSAVHFNRGSLEVHQALLARRGEAGLRTRRYMYT
jgi:cyclopropane-fatty-acyl-phospholipid synthase